MAIDRKNRQPSNELQSILSETPSDSILGDSPYIETEYDNGDLEYEFGEDEVEEAIGGDEVVNINDDFYYNLADGVLSEETLTEIGQQAYERFKDDEQSNADHLKMVNSGLNILGIKLQETSFPFPGACSAHHPLILESAVKFQAKAANELFNPRGPVKTAILGKKTDAKEQQAKRVGQHMNYQVMFQMEEYFDEMETLLFYLPLMGSAFKKTYYDAQLGRPVSRFVQMQDLVVNYYATNLKSSSCFTHRIPLTYNEYKKDCVSGFYREVENICAGTGNTNHQGETDIVVDELTGVQPVGDNDVMDFLEQYCYLDLEEDDEQHPEGIMLPYVVTFEKETQKVVAVRRNWSQGDELYKPLCPFTHYKFVPGLGFYGLGYIHLLGNLQMTLTASMRNLVDSGAFATLQGGFIDKRLRVRSNSGPIAPGTWKEVETTGAKLNECLFPLPFKEPSQTLLQMYQFIEARGQKFADSTEQVVSDASNYGPVGTTMALLEASTKFFSGVHRRLHQAQKNEFKILAAINYTYLEEEEEFDTVENTFEIRKDDYDGSVDIIPVSDPNVGSQAQRLTLAQAVTTQANAHPNTHDMREVDRYYYSAIGIDPEFVDKFVPPVQQAQPSDPISDLMMAQQGKPIKAFSGQDHDAHIQIKMAFLQDPQSGGNPMMQAVAQAVQANVQEHMMLKFQESVLGEAQQPQTVAALKGGAPMEAVMAQAAQAVTQKNQRMAELEQQSPDQARNLLAQSDMLRATTESRALEAKIEKETMENTIKVMQLDMQKYQTDMQAAIALIKQQSDEQKNITQQVANLVQSMVQRETQLETALKSKPKD